MKQFFFAVLLVATCASCTAPPAQSPPVAPAPQSVSVVLTPTPLTSLGAATSPAETAESRYQVVFFGQFDGLTAALSDFSRANKATKGCGTDEVCKPLFAVVREKNAALALAAQKALDGLGGIATPARFARSNGQFRQSVAQIQSAANTGRRGVSAILDQGPTDANVALLRDANSQLDAALVSLQQSRTSFEGETNAP